MDVLNADITTDSRMSDRVTQIVTAYLSHNTLAMEEVRVLIGQTHAALAAIDRAELASATGGFGSSVAADSSITPDFLVCLEDGRKFKSLRRHLASLGMSPEQYRSKWGLPADYPMVAPNYSARRSSLAKSYGLGRGGVRAAALNAGQ